MKNYNKIANQKEQETTQEPKKNFTEKLKEKVSRVDQSKNIKEEIRKQEEKIQALKNSISIYFVDKCEFVNLREEPSKHSLVINVLKHGTLVEPVLFNDTTEWTKVKYQNRTGYIMTKFIGVEVSEPIE